MDADATIAAIAATSHGHVTWAGLLAAGVSEHQVLHRRRSGLLVRVHPGVYRVASVAPSPKGRHMAGVLATKGVVSHRSAAWLLGLWDRAPRHVELTIARPMRWRSDLVSHRLTDLRQRDIATVDGIPCTDAARLLVDIGAVCSSPTVEKLFHKVLHDKRADFDSIVARFFQVARRGRSGAGVLRPILEYFDPAIAPCESDLEVELLRALRDHGVPEPTRQHPVDIDGHRFRLDMAYVEPKIFLEGDGFGVHTERQAFEIDRQRQNLLVLHGWMPLRFTWRMVVHTPWAAAKTVLDALSRHNTELGAATRTA